MTGAKSKTGPCRTACHTCRRRRKKCDLSRPFCERCLESGFECLGYGDDEPPPGVRRSAPHVPKVPRLRPVLPAVPAQTSGLEPRESVAIGLTRDQELDSINTNYDPRPPILGAVAYGVTQGRTITHSLGDFGCSWPQDQSQLTTYRHSPTQRSSSDGRLVDVVARDNSTSNYLSRIIETLRWSFPRPVDTTQLTRENHFAHIIDEYRLQRSTLWFMCPSPSTRDLVVARLSRSKTMMWTMWVGTKLFHALSQNPRSAAVRECISWIDNLEQKFATESHSNPPLDDVADRFLAQLELMYLKFTTVGSISGYTLMQKALPRFLRLVAADTNLYMEHPNGNLVVSFPRALSAPRDVIERFVIYDTAAAFVLGVPPLVEYGYDDECDCASHAFEWIHGVPPALIQTISQINSWRAGSRVPPLDDWRTLERDVLDWEPRIVAPHDEDSAAGSVSRLAVQESWRHVVLIYLYLGICGVSSHDPRVQASIRQIVQLGEIVANLPIGIHMFTHFLIVGIGARLEKHRSLVREKLLSFKDTRVWLFRGPQFSKVLDHLWHGVGVGGAPVTWDDYVQSRCVVIPI